LAKGEEEYRSPTVMPSGIGFEPDAECVPNDDDGKPTDDSALRVTDTNFEAAVT